VGRTVRAKKGLRERLGNHLRAQSSFVISYLEGRGKRLKRIYISVSRGSPTIEHACFLNMLQQSGTAHSIWETAQHGAKSYNCVCSSHFEVCISDGGTGPWGLTLRGHNDSR
jgi:hypothetical protein